MNSFLKEIWRIKRNHAKFNQFIIIIIIRQRYQTQGSYAPATAALSNTQ